MSTSEQLSACGVCFSVWPSISTSHSTDVLVCFLLTGFPIPTIFFRCVLELTHNHSLTNVPALGEVSVHFLCLLVVFILNFSHFCLSHFTFFSNISFFLCVSQHFFLCHFISLSLLLAIVLSLQFSPLYQFCLFVIPSQLSLFFLSVCTPLCTCFTSSLFLPVPP